MWAVVPVACENWTSGFFLAVFNKCASWPNESAKTNLQPWSTKSSAVSVTFSDSGILVLMTASIPLASQAALKASIKFLS